MCAAGPRSVVALGGGHGLHASLHRAAAPRRRPRGRRPHRGRHRRRQRRLVGPAARRVRRAAARRPADGAGRALRRRRLGRHLVPGAAAPLRRRRRDARPRRRQPAHRRPVGAARRPRRRPSTGSAGCSGATGRVLPMALTPLDIAAEVRGLVPGDPDALTTVRGQVEVATTGGVITSIRSSRPTRRPAPRRSAAIRDGRLGGARARARGSPR